MSRHLLYLALLLVLSACDNPAYPGSIQSHLDTTTPDLKVNGVTILPPAPSFMIPAPALLTP